MVYRCGFSLPAAQAVRFGPVGAGFRLQIWSMSWTSGTRCSFGGGHGERDDWCHLGEERAAAYSTLAIPSVLANSARG